ncbi:MAG: protein-disulfide reductase DsbD N-terminal domain-containing protein, partial [Planctomycetota bacterium JB042]
MQNRTRAAWLAALLLALGAPTAAARGLVKVSAAFDPAEAAPGTTVDLVVTADVEPGYHMYAPDSPSEAGIPTSIEVSEAGGLVEAGEWTFSKPKSKFDDIFEVVVRIHEGEVEFRRPYRVPDGASGTITLKGAVDLQACDENSCTREEPEFTATLAVGGDAGGATAAEPAPASDGSGADGVPEPELGFDLIAMSAGFEPATARAGEVVTLKMVFAIAAGRHLYAPDSPAGLP